MFKRAADLKMDDMIDLSPIFEYFEKNDIGEIDPVDKFAAECEYALVDEIVWESSNIVVITNTQLNVAVSPNYMVEVANV